MNKERAIHFLELIANGDVDAAYEQYALPTGKHHNVYFSAGFESLKKAMLENQQKYPHKQYSIKHAVAEGDMVAVYGHVTTAQDDPGIIAVHFIRFADGKIAELWDAAQTLSSDSPNTDGPF